VTPLEVTPLRIPDARSAIVSSAPWSLVEHTHTLLVTGGHRGLPLCCGDLAAMHERNLPNAPFSDLDNLWTT